MASRLVEQYKAKAEHCERAAAFSQFPETGAEYRRLAEQWRELAQETERQRALRRHIGTCSTVRSRLTWEQRRCKN
jgi:hypothetical protein